MLTDTTTKNHTKSGLMKTILNITEDASPPALEARTPSIAEPGRRGIRILIVEDSRASRLIAAAILQNEGFEVGEAGSGAEAIEKFRKADFDLVLMDLQMSGMDGFEATRAIRNLEPEFSNTPIIAFSANVMEEARHHCLEAGMNDFVSKPFVKETLLDRIAQWT